MKKKINIGPPIKQASKNMVKYFFEEYYDDTHLGIKNRLLKHIDDCEIEAFADEKGSKVSITQKSIKPKFNPLDN